MTCITTLLVTRDPSVLNEIQQLHDETEFARLEVCGRIEKVLPRLGRDGTLLLVHLDAETDPERLRGVLVAADRSSVTAVLLSVPAAAGTAVPTDLGAYPTYHLPTDRSAL